MRQFNEREAEALGVLIAVALMISAILLIRGL